MKRIACLTTVLFLLAVPALAAAGPPDELAAPVARALGDGVAVAAEGSALVRVWPAAAAPTGGGAAGLGIAFPSLTPGGLLGAVEVGEGWTDYQGQAIAPGVYTLRYGVMPEDGYHMGVAMYRDFALLVPAAEDADPAPWGEERLIEAAGGAAGSNHPAVLALWPAGDHGAGESFANDLGQPTLAVAVGEVTVGLVVAGQGEVEE